MSFDWSKTDLRLGLWFALVSFTVMNLAHFQDASWMTAGLSALLAWLPLLLTDHRHLRSGVAALLIYLVAGGLLSLVGHLVLPHEIGRILAVGLVAFAAAALMRFGTFWYLTGFVLIFWYVISPLFSASLGLGNTLEGHFVGVLGISAYWIIRQVRFRGRTWNAPPFSPDPVPDRIALPYAGVLSATVMTGIAVGGRLLTADPTLMAQASLNIISPSAEQTWQAGLGRMIFGMGGVIVGFYIGWVFPGLAAQELVIALCSFFALAFYKVNMALLVGAFAVMFSYPMGARGDAVGHALGNERLLAEILGILLAGFAISALSRLTQSAKQ
ncbi:FUSC family protein [Tropicimonas marinistellae]|uniref:FUSC family protein n=1 Tax=Tropicimonas marinistellae TaxID=1739787 RepID=UPI00082BB6B6|nr:FUSC family protein [Tropicimonas marinistellae]